MPRSCLITIVLILALLVVGWFFLYPRWQLFWIVDGCLDSGGAWDYEAEVCEYCEDPECMSPFSRCYHFGGEWDTEENVCVGATGDPWPPSGGFQPLGD